MKYSIIIILGAALLLSCSHDDADEIFADGNATGEYVYTMHLDSNAPGYDSNNTRATSSWDNGSTIYLRFKSGSSYISGTAVYSSSSNMWTVTSKSSLSTTSTATQCEAYYFKNGGTVYTNSITLTEQTACYKGSGTFTHPTSSDIFVRVTLDPMTWRMRFNGSSGSSLTISSSSHIKYYTSFNRATGEFTTQTKNVSLTVGSTGYTPYIHGTFTYTSGTNTIYLQTGGNTFYKNISASSLPVKNSAYMVVPTTSNYSSNGWTRESKYVSNCDLKTNYAVPFTNEFWTQWTIGSNASRCWKRVYKSSEISGLSDSEIISKLKSYSSESRSSLLNVYSFFSGLNSASSYVLCTYCENANGDHGNLVKYSFTTVSLSAPKAEIYNPRYNSSYHIVSVLRRNNASSYYLACIQGSNINEYYSNEIAYLHRCEIMKGNGKIEYSFSTDIYFNKTSKYVAFTSWARNSSGQIGQSDEWRGVAGSRLLPQAEQESDYSGYAGHSVPAKPFTPDIFLITAP